MTTVLPSTIIKQLQWRYATKSFDPSRKISAEDWRALESALVLSPSSYGLQPWKFVVVTSAALKEQLPAAAWDQTQPKDCSHFVVIAARRTTDPGFVQKFVDSIADKRHVPASSLDEYKKQMNGKAERIGSGQFEWNSRQCYIALGMLLSTAAVLKIDACPMEGIVASSMDSLLGLAGSDYTSVVACALGYRAADDNYATLTKVRFPAGETVIHL